MAGDGVVGDADGDPYRSLFCAFAYKLKHPYFILIGDGEGFA